MTRHALVVRLDSMGDVLVSGPAVRAVAATVDRVSLLVGPRGAAAARLLPGVDDVLVWNCPWIAAPAPQVADAELPALVEELRGRDIDEALVLTSYHQSALPTALLLRQAGVARIAAISEDYPGSLLDVRVPSPPDAPESERMLAVAVAAGYRPGGGEDRRPQVIRSENVEANRPTGRYVVVHPGADAPARAYPAAKWRELVAALTAGGETVVVTGAPDERALTHAVASAGEPGAVLDLGGRTELAELAEVLRGAAVVVVANTGPAHLAAAVGAPVVSLFAPVVPAERWAPHGAPRVVLGDQAAPCAGSRARECPVPGHPCLTSLGVDDICAAVHLLAPRVPAGVAR